MNNLPKLFSIISIIVVTLTTAVSVHALTMDVSVPEKYAKVIAGERVYFEITIRYPENPTRKGFNFNYEIKKDDEVVIQESFLRDIGSQAVFVDNILIPENSKDGMYNINVEISDFEGISKEASADFYVVGKFSYLKKFFIIFGAIIALTAVLLLLIIIKKRKQKTV